MPTIEIISIDNKKLGIDQEEFGFAIIEETELISHRGLYYDFLRKYQGTILHIGNPEFKNDKDGGFWGGDLIDWEFDNNDNFKFQEKYKSDFLKLLESAIENSPDKQAFFLTDIQANEPEPKFRRINSFSNFAKLYEHEGLEWNTLYAINVQHLRNSLYSEVDWVLWNDWDPIGVNDYGGPSDEYTGYVPQIYKLLTDLKDETEIAEHLDFIATDNMGLNRNPKESQRIARLLIEKREKYEGSTGYNNV
ncbi:hypothetical protein [Labilibaculum euxinus]